MSRTALFLIALVLASVALAQDDYTNLLQQDEAADATANDVAYSSNGKVEVAKIVTAQGNNYAVRVEVKPLVGGISNIRIVDSLPESLDLVTGSLVVKAKQESQQASVSNAYTVKPDVNLKLSAPTLSVELPGAVVMYDLNGKTEETTTNSPKVTLSVPKFTGSIDATYIVAGVSLVLPVVAAVTLIGLFGSR